MSGHAVWGGFVIRKGRVAGETIVRHAGETAFFPRRTEHTFRVTDDGPSRHLVIVTPDGFEGVFEEMAAGQFMIPDDMGSIEEGAV